MCNLFVGITVAHVWAIPESPVSQNQVNCPYGFTGDPEIALQKRVNGDTMLWGKPLGGAGCYYDANEFTQSLV